MAFESSAAQAKVVELENKSASIVDQLEEAAKFIAVDLYSILSAVQEKSLDLLKSDRHGREEWVLKWLLKQWQSPGEQGASARSNHLSWRLFLYVCRIIPLGNVARILSEKKFVMILRQTLGEAQGTHIKTSTKSPDPSGASDSSSTVVQSPVKASKKRKRFGEFAQTAERQDVIGNDAFSLFQIIAMTMNFLVPSSITLVPKQKDDDNGEYRFDYMYATFRTSSLDAARILGSWYKLCHKCPREAFASDSGILVSLLNPPARIYQLHAPGTESVQEFAEYCLEPILQFYLEYNSAIFLPAGDRTLQLIANPQGRLDKSPLLDIEKLLAENVVIPAKASFEATGRSDLLLATLEALQLKLPAFAPVLLDVAVRSLRPQGMKRRSPNDTKWLENCFQIFERVLIKHPSEQSNYALQSMLHLVLDYQISLELPLLRLLTTKYVFSEGSTDWRLLATIIKLDSNVFLILDDTENRTDLMLSRITAASLQFDPLDDITSGVIIPLIEGYARARDLVGFIHRWHEQLAEAIPRLQRVHSEVFSSSTWEDESIQLKLREILESSLTLNQLVQLVDWLELQHHNAPGATDVILDAIGGALSREETIDAVDFRLYRISIATSKGEGDHLAKIDDWRKWRIATAAVESIPCSSDKDLGILEIVTQLSKFFASKKSFEPDREHLEAMRCLCATWCSLDVENSSYDSLTKVLSGSFILIKALLKDFMMKTKGESKCQVDILSGRVNIKSPQMGAFAANVMQLITVDYPKVLGIERGEETINEVLRRFFWIASATSSPAAETSSSHWMRLHYETFPRLWLDSITNDFVLNNHKIRSRIIETMLDNRTNEANPFQSSPNANGFAVVALLQLPDQSFSKSQREMILKSWSENLQHPDIDNSLRLAYDMNCLDPAIISLKAKMMNRSIFYEGMRYNDLIELAKSLMSENQSPFVMIPIFEDLAKSTLSRIVSNPTSSRNAVYIKEAVKSIRKQLNNIEREKYSCAAIVLRKVTISAITKKLDTLEDAGILSKPKYEKMTASHQKSLISDLKYMLKHPQIFEEQDLRLQMSLRCIIDALRHLSVGVELLKPLDSYAESFLRSLPSSQKEVYVLVETFFLSKSQEFETNPLKRISKCDIGNNDMRNIIQDYSVKIMENSNLTDMVTLAKTILESERDGANCLNELLSLSHILALIPDLKAEEDGSGQYKLGVSSIVSLLLERLQKASSVREFCLVSEILDRMLRQQPRAISQWNIDNLLSTVTSICSYNGPSLRASRAGAIYLHLCRHVQAVLSTHRLKLQGHFALLVQALQALLGCLFVPLSHSTYATRAGNRPPPWLSTLLSSSSSPSSPSSSSSRRTTQLAPRLGAAHGAALARLLSMVCDPTVSSVTRGSRGNASRGGGGGGGAAQLTSATDVARRAAGQHMPGVLAAYVRMRLEMSTRAEVVTALAPGLYAILDTTTAETRRALGDTMDAAGRAMLGELIGEYRRFGKWRGN